MSVSPCDTWECINSFANWLAAIGTILAVAVALWLSARDRTINLRAGFDIGITSANDPTILDQQVFILSFTNYGPRTVHVENFSLTLPFCKGVIFLFPQMDSKVSHLCTKLPAELLDGKSGNIFSPVNFFNTLEKPELVLFPSNRLLAWMRIQFFQSLISTSVGKRVRVKVNKRARKKLWNLYCKLH